MTQIASYGGWDRDEWGVLTRPFAGPLELAVLPLTYGRSRLHVGAGGALYLDGW